MSFLTDQAAIRMHQLRKFRSAMLTIVAARLGLLEKHAYFDLVQPQRKSSGPRSLVETLCIIRKAYASGG